MIRWCNLYKSDISKINCPWKEYEGCEKIVIVRGQQKMRCPQLQIRDKEPEIIIPF
jgi:hypothetical protein